MLIRPYIRLSKLCILWILIANCYGLSDSGNFNESSFRTSRDTTDSLLLDFTNNLNRLSRLTNGLSLEIGLIDGSLQSDTVLQELLHLGSLKFQDLSSLDMKTVSGSVSKLEAVSKGLDSSEDVTKIEKRFSIFEEIRVSKDMDDFVALPGKNEYRSLLDEVVKLGETQVDLKLTKTKIDSLVTSFSEVGYWAGSLTEDTANDAKTLMGAIPTAMKNVEDVVKSFEPLRTIWSKARSLRENSKFLDILYTESYFRGNLSETLKFENPEVMGKVRKNVESLYELRAKIEGSGVTVLQKFLETSGVSNDLEALKTDIEDPWISARILDTKKSLKIAVSSFDPVIGELAKVREDWKVFLDEDSTRQSSKLFVDSELEILEIPKDNKPILDVIEKLEKCAVDRQTTGANLEQHLEEIISLIKELNGKIDQVESLDYIEELKDLSTLKTFLSVTKKTDETNVQFISGIAKKVTADPKFKSVKRILAKFQKELDTLNPLISEVPELVRKITPEFHNVDSYQKSVNNALFTDFYTCVKNVGENGAGVKVVFENLDKVREIGKNKDLDTTKSVIQAIESSQKDLKTLKDTVENLKKGSAIPEVNALKESFPNSQKVSQELSKAVEGLEAIGKALESRDSLKILQDSKLLGKLQKVLDNDDGAIIQKMSELKQSISKTFQDIDEFSKVFQDSRKTRNSNSLDFKSNGKILEAASKISDVKFDIDSLRQALESLNPKLKIPELSDLQKSLDSLKSLDLVFSKFGFKDAASSLEALDTFFVTYSRLSRVAAQLPSPKPLVGQKPNGTRIGATSELATTTVHNFFEDYWWGLVIGAIGLLVIGVSIYFACGCCKEKSKKDLEEGDADQEPDKKKNERSSSNPAKSRNPKKPSQSAEINSKGSTISKIETAIPAANDSNTGSSESNQAGLAKDPVNIEVKNEEKASKSGKAKRSKPSKSSSSKRSKASKSRKAKRSKPSKSGKAKRSPPRKLKVSKPSKPSKSKPSKPSGAKTRPVILYVPKPLAPSNGDQDPLPWATDFATALTNVLKKYKFPTIVLEDNVDLISTEDGHLESVESGVNSNDRIIGKCLSTISNNVTVAGFDDGYISVHQIILGEKKWFIGQMPMDGTEKEYFDRNKTRFSLKNNTIAKHLAMLIQEKVVVIIQSTPFDDEEGNRICARFYTDTPGNSLTFGEYTIQTLAKEETLTNVTNSNHFTKFQLEVKHGKTSQLIDLYQYDWPYPPKTICTVPPPPLKAPEKIEDGLDIIRICEEAKGNVLFQCRTGTGPSGTLLGIKLGIEVCMNNQSVETWQDIVRPVRKVRHRAIRTREQLFYLLSCVAEGVNNRKGIKPLRAVSAMVYYYNRFVEGVYAEKNKDRVNVNPPSWDFYEKEIKRMEKHCDEQDDGCKMLPSKKDQKNVEEEKNVKVAEEAKPKESKPTKAEKGKTEIVGEEE